MELKDVFASWYRPAAAVANIAPDQYTLRRQAVEAFVAEITLSQVLGLVRLVFQKSGAHDTTSALTATVQTHDPAYVGDNNDFDLQILAAICLNFLLNSKINNNTDAAALAVLTSEFRGLVNSYPAESVSQDLLRSASSYLVAESQRVRRLVDRPGVPQIGKNIKLKTEEFTTALSSNQFKPAIEHLTAVFQTLVQQAKTSSETMESALSNLNTGVQVQEELTTILWWMSGEYSRDLGVSYRTLEVTSSSLLAAKELADLTLFWPALYASKGILHRILSLTKIRTSSGVSQEKPTLNPNLSVIKIKDVLNDAPKEWDLNWLDAPTVNQVSDLCPLHSALLEKKQFAKNWAKPYEQKMSVKVTQTLPALEMSYQFYLERMLVGVANQASL